LKPGPLFGKLKNGEAVANNKGELITPEMVVSGSTPGAILLVLRVPTAEYIPDVVQNDALSPETLCEFPSSSSYAASSRRIICLVHMVPKEVLENDQYKQWCAKFDQYSHIEAQHIGIHESLSARSLPFGSQSEDMYRLHRAIGLPYFPLVSGSMSKEQQAELQSKGSSTLISFSSSGSPSVSHNDCAGPKTQTGQSPNLLQGAASLLSEALNNLLPWSSQHVGNTGREKSDIQGHSIPTMVSSNLETVLETKTEGSDAVLNTLPGTVFEAQKALLEAQLASDSALRSARNQDLCRSMGVKNAVVADVKLRYVFSPVNNTGLDYSEVPTLHVNEIKRHEIDIQRNQTP